MRKKATRTWRKKGVGWGEEKFQAGDRTKSISSACFRFLLITLCASRSLHSTSAFIQSVFIKDLLYARPVWGARNEVCVFEWNYVFFEQSYDPGSEVWECVWCVCVYIFLCISHNFTCTWQWLFSSSIFRRLPFICCVYKVKLYLFDFYTLKAWWYDN